MELITKCSPAQVYKTYRLQEEKMVWMCVRNYSRAWSVVGERRDWRGAAAGPLRSGSGAETGHRCGGAGAQLAVSGGSGSGGGGRCGGEPGRRRGPAEEERTTRRRLRGVEAGSGGHARWGRGAQERAASRRRRRWPSGERSAAQRQRGTGAGCWQGRSEGAAELARGGSRRGKSKMGREAASRRGKSGREAASRRGKSRVERRRAGGGNRGSRPWTYLFLPQNRGSVARVGVGKSPREQISQLGPVWFMPLAHLTKILVMPNLLSLVSFVAKKKFCLCP